MIAARVNRESTMRSGVPTVLSMVHGRLAWRPVMVMLALVDALALAAAFALAYVIRFAVDLPVFREAPSKVDFYLSVVIWALPIWLALFALCRLYDRRYLFSGFGEYSRIAVGCSLGILSIIVISFFYELESIARAWLILLLAVSIATVWTGRFLARRAVWQLRARGELCRPTIVVGTNEEGRLLAMHLSGSGFSGARILGFVDHPSGVGTGMGDVDGLPVLGSVDDLEGLVDQIGQLDVVIASTGVDRATLLELYRRLGHDPRVELRLSSGLFEILTTGMRVQEIGGIPLMTLHRVRITGIDAVLKAALDLVVAGFGVLVISPVLLVVAIAVRLDGPGPILHRRRVVGRNGSRFDAFKFRTMIPDRRNRPQPIAFADRRLTDKSECDPRVTRIGRFLRRTSLDELPQLFNVLRGEMSLVGPRMISADELPKFGAWQVNLLTVKPGITGPWQVRGRASIAYEERVRLNMEYIRGYTIWRDLEILVRTVPAVIRGQGAF